MKLKCVGCGKEREYNPETVGSYNIGQLQRETGWHFSTCKHSYDEIFLCKECHTKAEELIFELLKIVKTPFYNFEMLVPFEIKKSMI